MQIITTDTQAAEFQVTLTEDQPAQQIEPTMDTSEVEMTFQIGAQPTEVTTQAEQDQVTQTTTVTKEETVVISSEQDKEVTTVTTEEPKEPAEAMEPPKFVTPVQPQVI